MQLDLYGMGETQTADEKDPTDSMMAIIMLIMLIKLTLAMMMMRF